MAQDYTVDWSTAVADLLAYYECLWFFCWRRGRYTRCPYFPNDRQARVHIFSLALIFYLWNLPHYRSGTFSNDLRKNLRNVAIPGTGLRLSLLCHYRFTAYLFLLVGYPLICLLAAVHARFETGTPVATTFRQQLLNPSDWFSYWRLNCALASYHALETKDTGYEFEDKWTFLKEGQARDVPVSPWLTADGIVAKHRNEEGGLGYFSFRNAAAGGDWIIQEHLTNDKTIARLLPANAPLSTLRIVTASSAGLRPSTPPTAEDFTALSCVFRAGRAGALTDHSSVLFDVDMGTGVIKKATTNAHWYQLGLDKVFTCPWVSHHAMTHHPDCNTLITGQTIPTIAAIRQLCVDAHEKLAPRVPLIGWDVALTTKGMFLLEGNFSCNFFRGYFDKPRYVNLCDAYFAYIDRVRHHDQ